MSEPHAPTTEDFRQRWLEAHRVPASLGSEQIGHLRQQRLAEFDAWLDKVKADARREGQADAWDEGWSDRAGYDATPDADEPEAYNPCRKGN